MTFSSFPILRALSKSTAARADSAGKAKDAVSGGAAGPTSSRKAASTKNTLALWTAVAAAGMATVAIGYSVDGKLLMPGEVTTAHRFAEGCSTCHSNISEGKFGWVHGLVTHANPEKNSAACLSCHEVGENALSPHGAPHKQLEEIARRTQTTEKSVATNEGSKLTVSQLITASFATNVSSGNKVFCATCHKEHQGTNADLKEMSDRRCHTCHQVKFDYFETNHPEFSNYPFKRRTRIIFDHATHFEKHFEETRAKRLDLKKIPGVCADCHTSDQDRRHMTIKPFAETCSACHLPQIVGADRATGHKGIALMALPGIDLETLRSKGAPIGEWPEFSEAELTPLMKLLLAGDAKRRSLLTSASKLDLQDLSGASQEEIAVVTALVWEIKRLIHDLTTSRASDIVRRVGHATGGNVSRELMAKLIATMPRDVLLGAQHEWLPSLKHEMVKRSKTDWEKSFRSQPAKAEETEQWGGVVERPSDRLVTNPYRGRWYVNALGELIQEGDESEEVKRVAKGEIENQPKPRTTEHTSEPDDAEEVEATDLTLDEQAVTALDAESWNEFGGWYRKDHSILYKPTGHADPFARAWLDFSGAHIGKNEEDLAAPVFELLTHANAQGKCTKCHSTEAGPGASRVVQWHPSSITDKSLRFTTFVHEPHFRLLDDRGCLTCHEMKAPKNFAASYQSVRPDNFVSNFKMVEKKLCATCHKAEAARQDCQLCHKYHVPTIKTPITSTQLPTKARN